MEEHILVFALLTITTLLSLHVLHIHNLKPKVDTLSIHLAIVEVISSPINEINIIIIVPRDTIIIFKRNVVIVIGDIVDPRILAFNNSILKGITEHVICYDPSKVWFNRKVTLYKTSIVKLINRFGKIRIIPIGSIG